MCDWIVFAEQWIWLDDAVGEQHSVREFCQLAFHDVGIELEFVGEGMNEEGIDKATGKTVIESAPTSTARRTVVNLWGDPSKAKRELGGTRPRPRLSSSSRSWSTTT